MLEPTFSGPAALLDAKEADDPDEEEEEDDELFAFGAEGSSHAVLKYPNTKHSEFL